MNCDMHMHPNFINHPENFDIFVQKAIEKGMETICITEHMPLLHDTMHDRLPHNSVARYCEEVKRRSSPYAGRIRILCGIEVDYHPAYEPEIEAVLREGTFDYIIGSTHLHVPRLETLKAARTHSQFVEMTYANTLLCAKSGYFDAIAHMNMYRWIFTRPDLYPLEKDEDTIENHAEQIDLILSEMEKRNIRLEINTHHFEATGLQEDIYPDAMIASMALERRIAGVFGSDAHRPESIAFGYETVSRLTPYRELLGRGGCLEQS